MIFVRFFSLESGLIFPSTRALRNFLSHITSFHCISVIAIYLGILRKSQPSIFPDRFVNQTSSNFSTPSKKCWSPLTDEAGEEAVVDETSEGTIGDVDLDESGDELGLSERIKGYAV